LKQYCEFTWNQTTDIITQNKLLPIHPSIYVYNDTQQIWIVPNNYIRKELLALFNADLKFDIREMDGKRLMFVIIRYKPYRCAAKMIELIGSCEMGEDGEIEEWENCSIKNACKNIFRYDFMQDGQYLIFKKFFEKLGNNNNIL